MQIHRQTVALVDVIAEVDPVVAPLLKQKGQRLHVRSHEAVPDVEADPRCLGQVLVNLLLDASKYADARTDIELCLESRGDCVRTSVLDQGPGVPEEAMALIFEPFYRTTPEPRPGPEGVGLGLSIVRSIVEAHEGRGGVANRPGGGACFWFELPTNGVVTPPPMAW